MTEYELNQLTTAQLIALAQNQGTFLITTRSARVESELYYVGGHFIEVSYVLRKAAKGQVNRQVYSANHFPNTTWGTKYLHYYLEEINLPGLYVTE